MNNLLLLKGKLEHRAFSPKAFGPEKLPIGQRVCSSHITKLVSQLIDIKNYFTENNILPGALISVHYKEVIAKSNRLRILLKDNNSTSKNIRGAKFETIENDKKQLKKAHVFIYFVSIKAINNTIDTLNKVVDILNELFNGEINSDTANRVCDPKQGDFYIKDISKSNFMKVLLDCCYTRCFDIDFEKVDTEKKSIVTLYDTGKDTIQLLNAIGIHIYPDKLLDPFTILLSHEELSILNEKVPYLISMSVQDLTKFSLDAFLDQEIVQNSYNTLIKDPTDEPTVGVIDTLFDENVYFSKWVEYHNYLNQGIPIQNKDYQHGTAVTSIIVDGVRGNPTLDDKCGNFKVRHFGVATASSFSSFEIIKKIREIVMSNLDIKVWNLSLGSKNEIDENSISLEAYELDKIQNEYDVIFIIAGTNKNKDSFDKFNFKIGAPADSLNSITVNSVSFDNQVASYSRCGPVLSFYNKPDVSYYGGDGCTASSKISVCSDSLGQKFVSGTSFSAPWVTRKIAFLIYKLGLSREVAKALIIDAARTNSLNTPISNSLGYGIVPIDINDIISSKDDEIKFVLTGTTQNQVTYTYNLPVPVVDKKHPYKARATLVYFTQCDRAQGVDYPCCEIEFKFGRFNPKNSIGKPEIIDIKNNLQYEEGFHVIHEEDARKLYRKWDNVKYVCSKQTNRSEKSYGDGTFGIQLSLIKRENSLDKSGVNFGLVITLKEIKGINRIDDFIMYCNARGWIVDRLTTDVQNKVYEQGKAKLSFE